MSKKRKKTQDELAKNENGGGNDAKNSDLLADISDLRDQLMISQEREKRSLADYQNLLRRVDSERSQIISLANKQLLESLLPVYDNLQTAASQLNDKGLNIVVDQFKQVLNEIGVKEIEALGKKFDVETMEAVDRQEDGDTVVEVMRRGFKLKDKVLMHAKVILGNKK
ncbi:MAG: Protein GrpE [Microgenomates bacterium 39_7]|nr:MAG: Protein GrpE [Microgenomates bacterium 39_7]